MKLIYDMLADEPTLFVLKCVKSNMPESTWRREIDIMRRINEAKSSHLVKYIDMDNRCVIMNFVPGYNLKDYFLRIC